MRRLGYPGGQLLLILSCFALLAAWGKVLAGDAMDTRPAPLELDAPVEPLEPQSLRSEAEEDRLAALSLFGAARMREQQDDRHGALRFYQRAARRDPDSLTVLREIVPLSFDLGRADEAMRYAVKVAQLDPSDGLWLRRLGVHLTTSGEFDQALTLYESALEVDANEPPNADRILLWWHMAKLYFALQRADEAADMTERVMQALEEADATQLGDKERRLMFDDAAQSYETLGMVVGDKDSPEALAYCFYGELLLTAGRPESAREAFAHAQQIDPQEARRHLSEAHLLAAEEKPAEALAELEAFFATGETAEGRDPYELLGQLLESLDRGDELIGRLEALYEASPDHEPLAAALADRYRAADQLEAARKLYVQLLEKEPSIEGYRGLVDVYRRLGDTSALLELLRNSLLRLRSFELLGDAGEQLADDRAVVENLFAEARERMQAEPALDHETAEAMATLALEADEFAAAGQFFEHAGAAQPEARSSVLRKWGLGLLFREQYDDAAEVLQQAAAEAESETERAELLYHAAGALTMDEQMDEALAAAEQAAELAENHREQLGDGYFRLISRPPWILYYAQRYDESAAAYGELIERFDRSENETSARQALREARLILSNIAVHQQDLPTAEEWLEQILDEFPDDISALNDLGYLWADQGKYLERALGMIQQALAAEPQNMAYRDSLGWAYYKLGRYDEAIEQLERAAEVDEPDGVILDHLGDAYAKADRLDDARSAWQRAIERFDAETQAVQLEATRAKLEQHATTDADSDDAASDD